MLWYNNEMLYKYIVPQNLVRKLLLRTNLLSLKLHTEVNISITNHKWDINFLQLSVNLLMQNISSVLYLLNMITRTFLPECYRNTDYKHFMIPSCSVSSDLNTVTNLTIVQPAFLKNFWRYKYRFSL